MNVLLVEDDPGVRGAVERALRHAGHQPALASDGIRALEQATALPYDAVVLDLGLPGIDGLEVCRRLRATGNHVPVLMLTARAAVAERVAGLDAGADDYLVKPFAFGELLARLRALVRRGVSERPAVLTVGDVELDPAAHTVTREGRIVDLSVREFSLLEFLMRHAGEVVSRTRILEQVWDVNYDSFSNVVDVYVGYLRRKLELPFGRPFIRTVRGVGYVVEGV